MLALCNHATGQDSGVVRNRVAVGQEEGLLDLQTQVSQ